MGVSVERSFKCAVQVLPASENAQSEGILLISADNEPGGCTARIFGQCREYHIPAACRMSCCRQRGLIEDICP